MKITAAVLVLAIVSLSTASVDAGQRKKKSKPTPSFKTMRGNGFYYEGNLAVWRGPDCSVDMYWVDKSRIISVSKGGKCTVTGLQECTVIYK